MRLWVRLAFRELLRNRRFALFFVMNLSIGLMGFIALDSFNYSIQHHLGSNLKEILTGDLAVYSSRPLTEDEHRTIDRVLGPNKEESRQITFLTMISTKTISRLARIIAVDDAYPLYGGMILERNGSSVDNNEKIPEREEGAALLDFPGTSDGGGLPNAYVSRDLAITLNVTTGDRVRIGTMTFSVGGVVVSSPGTSVTSMEFAPSIYIGIPYLEQTGLLGFGSRIRYGSFYRFPQGTDGKAKTIALRGAMRTLFSGVDGGGRVGDPPISVFDSEDVNRNLGRLFGYFTGYMGLVAIVALFLAGIGTAYLFRSYLDAHLKEMAILMSLGASRMETRIMLLCQVMSLGLISTLLSVLFSLLLLPIFPTLFKGLIPNSFEMMANPSGLLLASFLGTLGSVIFCLPVFVRIYTLKPVVLLQDGNRGSDTHGTPKPSGDPGNVDGVKRSVLSMVMGNRRDIRYFLSFLPALFTFWLLAVEQTRSWERGTLFLLGFVGVMGIMALIGRGGVALVGADVPNPSRDSENCLS